MSASALAAQLVACVVVHVADGDTLTVRCGADQATKQVVRLAEVDAPEDGQPFGAVSRRALVEACLQKPATLAVRSRDVYGRAVAKVSCAGADAGAAQVAAGLAWVFDRYARDAELYRLQDRARSSKAGLWSDPAAMPPWEWRKAHPKARSRV